MVAITSGGLVPAAMVARELDMRVIETICLASHAQQKIQGDPRAAAKVFSLSTIWPIPARR